MISTFRISNRQSITIIPVRLLDEVKLPSIAGSLNMALRKNRHAGPRFRDIHCLALSDRFHVSVQFGNKHISNPMHECSLVVIDQLRTLDSSVTA